jgi:hypothetical protein
MKPITRIVSRFRSKPTPAKLSARNRYRHPTAAPPSDSVAGCKVRLGADPPRKRRRPHPLTPAWNYQAVETEIGLHHNDLARALFGLYQHFEQ